MHTGLMRHRVKDVAQVHECMHMLLVWAERNMPASNMRTVPPANIQGLYQGLLIMKQSYMCLQVTEQHVDTHMH